MTQHFKDSITTGGIGEHVVWNVLNNKPNVRQVVDVRLDKRFQEMDVDFMIENNQRQFYYIEIKTDQHGHETGNIVYEKTTSGNIGCLEKTKADYIFFYIVGSQKLLIVRIDKLREYIKKNKRLRLIPMGDNGECYLLNIDDLRRQKVIEEEMEGIK